MIVVKGDKTYATFVRNKWMKWELSLSQIDKQAAEAKPKKSTILQRKTKAKLSLGVRSGNCPPLVVTFYFKRRIHYNHKTEQNRCHTGGNRTGATHTGGQLWGRLQKIWPGGGSRFVPGAWRGELLLFNDKPTGLGTTVCRTGMSQIVTVVFGM